MSVCTNGSGSFFNVVKDTTRKSTSQILNAIDQSFTDQRRPGTITSNVRLMYAPYNMGQAGAAKPTSKL